MLEPLKDLVPVLAHRYNLQGAYVQLIRYVQMRIIYDFKKGLGVNMCI